MRTTGECRRGIAPRPAGIGSRAAQQRRTVKDLDRRVGFRGAGQGRTFALVMPSPTVPVSGENDAMVGATGAVVSMVTLSAEDATLVLAAASLAVAVRLWGPVASAAVV